MQTISVGTMVRSKTCTPEYIKSLIPYGFECFALFWWQNFNDAGPDKLLKPVQDALKGSNAFISTLTPFGNPMEYDELAEIARKNLYTAIDYAEAYNTDLVTAFTGRVRGKSIPDNIERFKEVWAPLAEYAAKKKVRLAFENCPMSGDWNNGDWNIAFNPDCWELMFEAVPAENVGLQWEPCHQMGQMIDPMPQIRKWGHKFFNIHGKDATVRHDIIRKHGTKGKEIIAWHRFPGFGDSNWTDIISELRLVGYKGTIDIEGWHDPIYRDDWEMTGQVHSLNYLKQCRGGEFIANPVKSALTWN